MAKYVAIDKIIDNIRQGGIGAQITHKLTSIEDSPPNYILAGEIAKKVGVYYHWNTGFFVSVHEKDGEDEMRKRLEKLDTAICLYNSLKNFEAVTNAETDLSNRLEDLVKTAN